MADCTADSAGGLTFDLTMHDGSAGRWDAALILRGRPDGCGGGPACVCPEARPEGSGRLDDPGHRDGRGKQWWEEVRLPLFPFGGTRLRATLPSTMTLDEGHWEAHVSLGDGVSWRLRTGHLATRPLNERTPGNNRAWLGVRVPYAGPRDGLTIRAWHRAPHAELARVRTTRAGLLLRGRLYGRRIGSEARLVAWPRGTAAAVRTDERGDVVTTTVRSAGDGTEFTGTLDLDGLSAPPAEWGLSLVPDGDGGDIPLARLLDDVPDKRPFVSYPAQQAASAVVTPYFTCANELALDVA